MASRADSLSGHSPSRCSSSPSRGSRWFVRSSAPRWQEALAHPARHSTDRHGDRERSEELREAQRDQGVELFDRKRLWPEGLMQLCREDAPEKQREEERHRRRERAASAGDEAGTEEDRPGDPEQDRRRNGERLGEGPPEAEPDRARTDGTEDAHQAHLRVSARERSHSPAAPASAPPIA